MVRQDTQKSRITPKGTKPEISITEDLDMHESSPAYVPIVMFASFVIGMGVILTNYLAELDALGMPSNWYLIVGLAFVLVGIITATRLR